MTASMRQTAVDHAEQDRRPAPSPTGADRDSILSEVQRKVLWLATSIIHEANVRRPNDSGMKVGGHQASSASMVSLMTSLWYESLTSADRVSVKPHASPVLHALNFLLGRLDASSLSTLRAFGGLQPYPSRTKDPGVVDYSTGSVGIGATAPVWGAITRRYARSHFPLDPGGRQISLLGDAELDEGAIWECVADPMVSKLGEVLWIVDLNRQSLDRVVPGLAVNRWRGMFAAAGWQVIDVKYGRRLQASFTAQGGDALRSRIDEMSNEEYQWLLRSDAAQVRERLCSDDAAVRAAVADLDDAAVAALLRDLGGHDVVELKRAYESVETDRPSVIFAYTIKGWGLPIQGHPENHSALLTEQQYRQLGQELQEDPDVPWRAFAADTAAGRLTAAVSERLTRPQRDRTPSPAVPLTLPRAYRGQQSTQAALGRVLTDLARDAPEVAARVVTVSPDVASSTNTGGWINKVGVWSPHDRQDWFASDGDRLLRWQEGSRGQHIELGIAEVNLVGLLGELGASWKQNGEPLLPIGTVYDPFVTRALEPWIFGTYAGGHSILIGTPSGVTLAAEGGAHQSILTPTIGLQTPGTVAYEPAFAVELMWCLLEALSRLACEDGESAYLRLTTRPIDQSLAALPEKPAELERRRLDVLAGGYRLKVSAEPPQVTVAAAGALVPEAVRAAELLDEMGIATDVCVLTSSDRLWRAFQARSALLPAGRGVDESVLDRLFPASRRSPLVTLVDGHPHMLSFLGSVVQRPISCLGVQTFGQAGSLADVYRHHAIDARAVVEAALDLVD